MPHNAVNFNHSSQPDIWLSSLTCSFPHIAPLLPLFLSSPSSLPLLPSPPPFPSPIPFLVHVSSQGEYRREKLKETIAPAMDISISSNFERFLYHMADDDANTLRGWMETFEKTQCLTATTALKARVVTEMKVRRAETPAPTSLNIAQTHTRGSQPCAWRN